MESALVAATLLAITVTFVNRWLPLSSTEGLDLTPSLQWPAPQIEIQVMGDNGLGDNGSMMITVTYSVDPAKKAEFRRIISTLRASRLHDGAIQWHLFKEPDTPYLYTEVFMVVS